MEGGLEQLMADKLRLEAEAQALRQHMTVMCLATVVDFAHGALKKAELGTANARSRLFSLMLMSLTLKDTQSYVSANFFCYRRRARRDGEI